MELFAAYTVNNFSKLKGKTIKLMSYASNLAAFVTTDNLLFDCSVDGWSFFQDELKYEITEINNFNYGFIQTLFCDNGHILIINEDNIIYGINHNKETKYSEIILKDFENDKIKFIRTTAKENIVVSNIFSTNDYIFCNYK